MSFISSPLKVPGDFLVQVNLEYCTKTVRSINNPFATEKTFSDIVAYPLIAGSNDAEYTLAAAGDEANITAMLIDGPSGQGTEVVAAGENSVELYQVLVHSPAILNQDKIPLVDKDGDEFDQAAIRTRLAALGYELRSEPVNSSTL